MISMISLHGGGGWGGKEKEEEEGIVFNILHIVFNILNNAFNILRIVCSTLHLFFTKYNNDILPYLNFFFLSGQSF